MIVHAFTVDVEDWYHGIKAPFSEGSRNKRLDRGLNTLLDLLSEYNVRATFFWLGRAAEENPHLLKKVVNLGHELGCHGLSHEPVCNMNPSRFRNDTLRASSIISDLTGREVLAYRAPYFSITRDSLWALDVLAELGFQYDSSILPIRKGAYGISGASLKIQKIQTKLGSITEIPISIRKICRVAIPVSGGGFFRLYPFQLTHSNFTSLEQEGRPGIFYIHPWELDPERPLGNQTLAERVKNKIGIRSTKLKLRKLLEHFSFSTISDVVSTTLKSKDAPSELGLNYTATQISSNVGPR